MKGDAVGGEKQKWRFSSVRRFSFSLRSRANGPLDFDGARRENILRGVGYAWSRLRVDSGFSEFPQTPRGRIFSLLDFYSHLNVLLMFRLNEAVRGCLIGPKTWDRIDRIFERENGAAVTAPRMLGAVWE